ncbi:MAG: ABC transporter permease [Reichenbachiella sp.]|uniref:ABC transporter permease n=1 Tax=Reichenbachiella sp. TaxID=2184521 RepID=UPI003263756F
MKNQGQKTQSPPRLAVKLFFWFCGNAAVEDLYGDLEELYISNTTTIGRKKANRIFWRQVLSLIFSYAVKKRKKDASYSFRFNAPSLALIANFLKVSARSLVKHKTFSFINIIGLAFGMSICLLGITMLYSIQQFDKFHVNGDRIYRINTKIKSSSVNDKFATTAPYVTDRIGGYTEQIESTITINDGFNAQIDIDENEMSFSGLYADVEFLKAFTFPLQAGNTSSALNEPFSLILTEKSATRLFGHSDVLGKVLEVKEKGLFKITGIMKDYPSASHLQFEALVSYSTLEAIDKGLTKRYDDYRFYINSYTYLLLKEGVSAKSLEEPLSKIADGLSVDNEQFALYLQPISNIVSGEDINYSIGPVFDQLTMAFFVFLTLIILLPACFNYANLSLARSLKRAKEIGLRKVVGGGRRDIFIQFLFETLIITCISLVGAVYIFTLIREEFLSMIIGADTLDLSIHWPVALSFIAFALFTSFLAGIIPAIYFSKMSAISSLKGGAKAGILFKGGLRNVLTVVQFCLSILFIFGAIAMSTQYIHTINYEKGFDESNKVLLPLHGVDKDLVSHEFSIHPEVQQIAFSSGVPGTPSNDEEWVQIEDGIDSVAVAQLFVDNSYLDLMKFEIIEGKKFIEDLSRVNEEQLFINETLLTTMNWTKQEALNKTLLLEGGHVGRVIGVVKDFNHLPVFEEIQPFFFRYNPDRFSTATMQVSTTDVFGTAMKFEATWETLNKIVPFELIFLEDKLDTAYQSLRNQIKIYSFLSFLAISIACLGLLGMVVFSMENKIKEIGIRKVMGASVKDLTLQLSNGFFKLMLIAAIIALPLAFVFFEFMLGQIVFYHAPLGWFELSLSLITLIILGGGTIVTQTLRAAKINPVNNLRYE